MKFIPWLAISFLIASPAAAQTVTPNFTQGSMTSTTTTTTTVNETIAIERLGGDYTHYSGVNVTPSGPLGDPSTTYSVTDPSKDYQLETITRAAGVVETEDITRTIQIDSVTNSLSVFSQ
jgi:hypothetical protein